MFQSKKHTPIQMTWKNVNCTLEQSSGPPCRRTTNTKQILQVCKHGTFIYVLSSLSFVFLILIEFLLQDVSGFAKPGTITAIIGSSGAGFFFFLFLSFSPYFFFFFFLFFSFLFLSFLTSFTIGKSTLLDILSGRKNMGKIAGDILVNGSERDARFKRMSAYVTQEDILMPTLTVYETLMFHQRLKKPNEVFDF